MQRPFSRLKGRHWLLLVLLAATTPARASEDAPALVEEMRAAYARLSDYQMVVHSTNRVGRSQEDSRALYRYKKPGKIRVDFLNPRPGWVLFYPSESGRAQLRGAGLLGWVRLSLEPSSSLLTVWPGQQVTQTDLGLLIENIARSVGPGRLGPVDVSRSDDEWVIRVDAENHFAKGIPTRYEFRVDGARLLPIGVREEWLKGDRRRQVRFLELRTDVGLADALFRPE